LFYFLILFLFLLFLPLLPYLLQLSPPKNHNNREFLSPSLLLNFTAATVTTTTHTHNARATTRRITQVALCSIFRCQF
jgi:hypothetical protein